MESSLFDFFREVVLPRDPGEYDRAGEERAPRRLSAGRRGRSARAAALCDEAAAVHRAGAGQRPRGHGVLPLQRAAVAQRSRRRSVALRAVGRGVSRVERATGARSWPFEMLATATHDTKLGEDVRARINVLSEMPDDWAREVVALDAHQHAAPVDRRRRAGAGSERRIPLLPGARRVWPAGCAGGRSRQAPEELVERLQAYMIKAVQGGQASYQLADAERGLRGRARQLRRARADRARRRAGSCPRSCRSSGGSPRSACQLAGAGRAQDRVPRRAGLLSGHGAVGSQPGRSRQPPAGRLRASGARCSTRSTLARLEPPARAAAVRE